MHLPTTMPMMYLNIMLHTSPIALIVSWSFNCNIKTILMWFIFNDLCSLSYSMLLNYLLRTCHILPLVHVLLQHLTVLGNVNLQPLTLFCLIATLNRPTSMPSMYAEDGVDDLSHCSDVRYPAALADQSTSHFISEGFVQYTQPTYDGALVELYPAHSSVDIYPPQITNNYGYNTNTFN